MKNQYVADISDFRKYGALRHLQRVTGMNLGVWWLLAPDDSTTDGRKLAYLDKPKLRACDPELFDAMKQLVASGQRTVAAVENAGVLPGAAFASEVVPDPKPARTTAFERARASLSECDLIFVDPDNGLDVPSKPLGTKNSNKFVFRHELQTFWSQGQSLVVYQHFVREKRAPFMARLASDLRGRLPGARIVALRTSHAAFFVVMQPAHADALGQAVDGIEAFWKGQIAVHLIGTD